MDLALSLDRLPLTRAALAAGLVDERRAEVIAEELAGLDDEHAAAVEKLIIGKAPRQTSGQLRALVRRPVLSADPQAARRRKDKALKDARVEMYPETSGTAALAGRDLPPATALAADKHLTALAQALKAAGTPGTLDTLRARAYLHLLSSQPPGTLILQTARPGRPGHDPRPGPGTGTHAPPAPSNAAPGGASPNPGPGPGPSPCPGGLPGLRGSVNLTMPLSAWLGWTQSPGDVPGYGPIDAEDSRTLAGLLAHHPANQWCVTLTSPAGHPVAHACASRGPGAGPDTPASPGTPRSPETPSGPATRAGPGDRRPDSPPSRGGPRAPEPPATSTDPAATAPPDWLGSLTFTTLETRDCTHPRQARGYQPSPSLRHLIQVRNPTCTAPGCRRPPPTATSTTSPPTTKAAKPANATSTPPASHNHTGWAVARPEATC